MGSDVPDELTETLSQLADTLSALRENINGRDITATVDDRGRLTIKEDDRKALGIDGERALLDMNVTVMESGMEPKRDGGQ